MTSYNSKFYDEMVDSSATSANEVIAEVKKYLHFDSVVDLGCGEGRWLKAFKDHGVKRISGYDGKWVELDRLAIDENDFHPIDFESNFSIPERADLVVSLEVAEHLPHEKADEFVNALVSVAPVVLFSAAIPLQGGSRHLNEQWPIYWADKFKKHGYVPVDVLRRKFWNNPKISFFYAQNIMFFVKETELEKYQKLKEARENGFDEALPLVHPYIFNYYGKRWKSVVPYIGMFPVGFIHFVKKFFK